MAKTNSKLEARPRKAKDGNKSNSSKIRKRNKRAKPHSESKQCSDSEPPVEKFQIFGWVIPDDFINADPDRHNVFIGKSPQDTLYNVRAALDLIRTLMSSDTNGIALSQESKHGLCLIIDNLMQALWIEREQQLGNL